MGVRTSGKLKAKMLINVLKKNKWRVGVPALILCLIILFVPLPDPLFGAPYSTILQSKNGTLLSASIAEDEQWRFPPSDSVTEKFQIAIRLFEDEYFDYHPGVNPISIVRAIYQNIKAGEVVSGGSTLSMQTIRMAYGNKSRTYWQKFVEILATLKLELLRSKSSILKLYVDHAPFGGNIVGINAASWRYYGRSPHQLSWAETATLAILPNNPASIFPGKNDEQLLRKRNALLEKIHSRGFMDEDQLFLSKKEPLPGKIRPLPNYAWHLLNRGKKEGLAETIIRSTLEETLQFRAGRIVENYSRQLAENQINNAAAVIIDIQSGNTVAYIGNTDNRGEHGQHVDIITAKRSPGSLLKPFLYAMALDDGLITPQQLLPDIPIFYKGFAPKNFDKEYRGAIPADEALTSSLNVPFVHLLIEYGYEKFHQKLVNIGFNSFDKPAGHYGLSMILGGAETSLWELTGAYAGMARASDNFMNRPINKGYSESDYRPNTYLSNATIPIAPLESDGSIRIPSIDFTLNVLKVVKRPEEESGWEFFESARPVSWKTGTSYGFRDAWAIGLNGKYVVGVWTGNADGEGRPGLTGIKTAAPLLFQLFDLIGGDTENNEPFGVTRSMCHESGMPASKYCQTTSELQIPNYMASEKNCIYHQLIYLNKDLSHRVNSSCYPIHHMKKESWFVLPPIQSWYYKKYHPGYKPIPSFAPGCEETEAKRVLELIYPRQFTRVHIPLEQDGKKGSVIFEAAHENRGGLIYWHLDDQYLGATREQHQMQINAETGPHLITLIDELGNEVQQKFEVIN
ncbi:MAG: penicillin-binding protein 1C [Cyclobacteriaceae bacterium]